MRITGVQSRVSPFLIAVVLLLQLSPALATGQPDAQQATIQRSGFPGMPVPSREQPRLPSKSPSRSGGPPGYRCRRPSRRGHSLQATSEAISAKAILSGRFSIAK
jgi:hypothetical protein